MWSMSLDLAIPVFGASLRLRPCWLGQGETGAERPL